MSCVIFGAGKIARGFIGHLLYLSNIPFIFVEKADSLAALINERGEYTVNILGNPDKNCVVKNARALTYADKDEIAQAIADADVVFNAVGGKNLQEIIPYYVSGIEKKAQNGGTLNFITCENWKKPADILRDGIASSLSEKAKSYFENSVGITEAVILRSAIEAEPEQLKEDPLVVNVQDYWQLHVDASRLKGNLPNITGLHLIPEFDGFLERKFYTYNAANGTTSYLGALLHYTYIADAAHDPFILQVLEGVYRETSAALCAKYGFSAEDQYDFTRGSLNKLQNYVIVDKIERNARDPVRKLGPDDRLVGSARMVESYGIVKTLPRRGALVLQYSDADVWEIYNVRVLLDMQVYEQIVNNHLMTDEHCEYLNRCIDRYGEIRSVFEKSLEEGQLEFFDLECRFHFYIHKISGLKWTAELLKKDEVSVAVYPEGTRNYGKELLPFHNGVLKIAQKAQVPLVIAAVRGTEDIHKNYPLRRSRVEIEILDVLDAEQVKKMRTSEIGDLACALIRDALA